MFLCKYVVYILVIQNNIPCGLEDYPTNLINNMFGKNMLPEVSNALVEYYLIGKNCDNIPHLFFDTIG